MGTHYAGTEEEVRALNTFIKFTRAANSFWAWLNQLVASYGLTTSQFGTLETLYHLGPMNQTEIAEKLLRSGGNMTLVIDNLESRGLVRRERQTEDRREITVHLTEEGKNLIARIFPGHVASITALFGVFTPQEQDELDRLSKIVGIRCQEM